MLFLQALTHTEDKNTLGDKSMLQVYDAGECQRHKVFKAQFECQRHKMFEVKAIFHTVPGELLILL